MINEFNTEDYSIKTLYNNLYVIKSSILFFQKNIFKTFYFEHCLHVESISGILTYNDCKMRMRDQWLKKYCRSVCLPLRTSLLLLTYWTVLQKNFKP